MRTIILLLCVILLCLACIAQEEPVSHQLEGIQQKIDKADQDLESRKKELANDPSLLALKQAYQTAKGSSDAFYQASNNKYADGTTELTQAKAQQKSLDAAANSALDALKAARTGLYAKDPALQELYFEKAELRGKYNLILSKIKIAAVVLGMDCARKLTEKTPVLEAKACLDMIFDGMKQHRGDPAIDDLFNLLGNISRGTPFFNTIQTSSGPVTIIDGSTVIDEGRLNAKKEFVDKYLATHKEDLSHFYTDVAQWEQNYDGAHTSSGTARPQVSSGTVVVPAAKKPEFVEPPPPVLPSQPPSLIDVLGGHLRDAIESIKEMMQPVRPKPEPVQSAIRG